MGLVEQVISVFLVGCRVGACLMLMPGFASARVPSRVRLFMAVVLAVVVAPIVADGSQIEAFKAAPRLAKAIATEIVVGAILGLAARIYVAGLAFAAASLASYIGLSGMQSDVETDEASTVLGSLVTALATLMLLMMDLHKLIVTALVESFAELPIGSAADAASALRLLASALQAAFLIGLQIVGPFLVYGILVNLIFGILGKLVPQVPSYFVSVPFLIAGGFVILYLALPEMMRFGTRAMFELLSEIRVVAP